MPRGVPHSPELRSQVVAAVLAGTSINQASRDFGIDKGLISRWMAAINVAMDATQKVALQDLILEYLVAGFRAMIVQATVYSDPDYCRHQDADKLAIAHGVLGDKLASVAATAQALGFVGVAESPAPALESAAMAAPRPSENTDG